MCKICAFCKKTIGESESYFAFLDNFLQAKYFDSYEDNIFCSEECACKSLFLTEIEPTPEACADGGKII